MQYRVCECITDTYVYEKCKFTLLIDSFSYLQQLPLNINIFLGHGTVHK